MLTLDGSEAGAATFNNAITSGAVITSGAGLVIADAGNIGSASDTDAIAIASNGVTTFSQAPVLSGASITAGTTPLTALDINRIKGFPKRKKLSCGNNLYLVVESWNPATEISSKSFKVRDCTTQGDRASACCRCSFTNSICYYKCH